MSTAEMLADLEQERPSAAHGTFAAIERRDGLDANAFQREYVQRNRPVIITGAPFWRGEEPLTPGLLKRWYGQTRLADMTTGHGPVTTALHMRRTPTLGDYVDRLLPLEDDRPDARFGLEAMETAEGVPYLTNMRLRENFPELARRFSVPACFGRNWLDWRPRGREVAQGEMFVGPPGTSYGKLHFDRYHLFVATYQLHGRKQWWLYPPGDSKYLYPMPFGRGWYPHLSPVDQERMNLDRYPLAVKASGLSAVLEAGEVLFCPASWWHNTRNLTNSISIAVRMVSAHNAFKAAADYAYTTALTALVEGYRASLFKR